MACPTCGSDEQNRWAHLADWCKRCGCLHVPDFEHPSGPRRVLVPQLVVKCRHIQGMVGDLKPDGPLAVLWHELDIPGSIHPPGDRT